MKMNGRRIKDDDVVIDVKMAVRAYSIFKKLGRDDASFSNHDTEDQRGVEFEFDKAIKTQLEILRADFLPAGWALASKQTLSNWSNSETTKSQIKRKRSVLIAVLSVTGVDISVQRILARAPLNFSPMAELSPISSKKLTNDPKEIEEVNFEVEIPALLLKSSELTVMSDWFVNTKRRKAKKVETASVVGKVTYGLREAEIEIDVGDASLVDWLRRVSPDSDPFLGRAEGCVIVWSDLLGRWIVQPLEGSPMRVRMEALKIAVVRARRGQHVEISIKASEDQIDSDFRTKSTDGRAEDSPIDEIDRARDRLFGIILSRRIGDSATLSYQRHKLP